MIQIARFWYKTKAYVHLYMTIKILILVFRCLLIVQRLLEKQNWLPLSLTCVSKGLSYFFVSLDFAALKTIWNIVTLI